MLRYSVQLFLVRCLSAVHKTVRCITLTTNHGADRGTGSDYIRDHMTSALRDLHWLPIQQLISYKLCVLTHLVHACTGNSPAYLVTTAANIPSESVLDLPRLTVMNHRKLVLRTLFFPTPGLKLGTACPMQFRKYRVTFSSVDSRRFCSNTRSLHFDRFLPLVTLGVSVGQLQSINQSELFKVD